MNSERPEIVVPEEASDRGQMLKGELQSADIKIPEVLAQLSKINPHNREAWIFFYPTLEQSKILQHVRPPFSFKALAKIQDGVDAEYRSTEIWPKYGSEITFHEMRCFTHCSGRLDDLHITTASRAVAKLEKGKSAWFLANECIILRILATPEPAESQHARDLEIETPVHKFQVSDGAFAEFKKTTSRHHFKGAKEIKERGYAVLVDGIKDAATARADVDCLLILASLASRERSDYWFWAVEDPPAARNEQHWRLGMGKWPRRPDGEEPLIPRDADHCSKFLSTTSRVYLNSGNRALFDSAVYALLSRDLTIETRIVRLFTGVQSALAFAVPRSKKSKHPKIKEQFEEFEKQHPIDLTDLWPLIDGSPGASLRDIRNALVHGEAFTNESDIMALSFATQNLQWILERILLTTLGWDVEISSVSARRLNLYTAHNWRKEQQSLKV